MDFPTRTASRKESEGTSYEWIHPHSGAAGSRQPLALWNRWPPRQHTSSPAGSMKRRKRDRSSWPPRVRRSTWDRASRRPPCLCMAAGDHARSVVIAMQLQAPGMQVGVSFLHAGPAPSYTLPTACLIDACDAVRTGTAHHTAVGTAWTNRVPDHASGRPYVRFAYCTRLYMCCASSTCIPSRSTRARLALTASGCACTQQKVPQVEWHTRYTCMQCTTSTA